MCAVEARAHHSGLCHGSGVRGCACQELGMGWEWGRFSVNRYLAFQTLFNGKV